MALVDYSGSEESEEEQSKPIAPGGKARTLQTTALHMVVNKSEPHKIRISLPNPSKAGSDGEDIDSEPPTKRAKLESSSFSGFNSMLPAPKRATAASTQITGKKQNSWRSSTTEGHQKTPDTGERDRVPLSQEAPNSKIMGDPTEGSKKPATFKPLSVAKTTKKAKPPNLQVAAASKETLNASQQDPTKISLFNTDKTAERISYDADPKAKYETIMHNASQHSTSPHSDLDPTVSTDHQQELEPAPQAPPQSNIPPGREEGPELLDTIAKDLNLSASARRQLFGRHSRHASNIDVVNFSIDEEYAANELLRQAGEQVQHNPVRAIAPGKHSLRQLVNAVSSQKDALEEQFASGRRNKKEAGSKYGW